MITRGMPFSEYLRLDSIHFSTLKEMDRSPLHFARASAHERADSDHLRLGRLVHAAILTPDEPPDVAIFDGPRRAGKAWDEFQAANVGRLIVKRSDLETAVRMRRAVMEHPFAAKLLSGGEPEVTIQWTLDGMRCRCRADYLRPFGALVELKTTRCSGPRAFMREFAQRLYHAQAAFYLDGLAAALGKPTEELPPAYVIAVEKEGFHDVCVYRLLPDTIEAGRRKVDAWIASVRECRRTGVWQGYDGGQPIDLTLPDWALADGLPDVDEEQIGGDNA